MTEHRIGEKPFLDEKQRVTDEVVFLVHDIEAQKKKFIVSQEDDFVWKYAHPILSRMRYEEIEEESVRNVALLPALELEDSLDKEQRAKNRRRRLIINRLFNTEPEFQEESIDTLIASPELQREMGKRILQLELISLIEKDASEDTARIERYIHAEIQYNNLLAGAFSESIFMERDSVFIETTPFSIEISIYDPNGDETPVAHQIITIGDEELFFNGEPITSFGDLADIQAILRSLPDALRLLKDNLSS